MKLYQHVLAARSLPLKIWRGCSWMGLVMCTEASVTGLVLVTGSWWCWCVSGRGHGRWRSTQRIHFHFQNQSCANNTRKYYALKFSRFIYNFTFYKDLWDRESGINQDLSKCCVPKGYLMCWVLWKGGSFLVYLPWPWISNPLNRRTYLDYVWLVVFSNGYNFSQCEHSEWSSGI